jgi:hypothetical protein
MRAAVAAAKARAEAAEAEPYYDEDADRAPG